MKIGTIILSLLLTATSFAQDSIQPTIELGIRSQKYTGFYWENGVTAEFHLRKLAGKFPLNAGVTMTFSGLGSAFHSNALPINHYDVFFAYYFRKGKKLAPTLRINIGYDHTKLGESIELLGYANHALVMGLEAGVSYSLPKGFRVLATGGYNFLVVNNTKSLGSSVYPVFGQMSVVYCIR